jgi:hypothetical protein
MSRFRQTDILIEMIELCQERMQEVRQQLSYYRASVYKAEMAGQIDEQIAELSVVGSLFRDEMLTEAFTDFDAMAKAGAMTTLPGECSFSKRVSILLAAVEGHLARLNTQAPTAAAVPADEVDFTNAVRLHRTQLLALCRQGSRQWTFFQAL